MALTYDRISEIAQQEGMNPDDAISLFSETDLGDSKVTDKDIQFVIRNAQKESHRTNDQRVRQYKSLPEENRNEETSAVATPVAASSKGITIDKKDFLNQILGQETQNANKMRSAIDDQMLSMNQTIDNYNQAAAALIAAQGGQGTDNARVWINQAAIDAKHASDVTKVTSALGINTDDMDSMVSTVMNRRLDESQQLSDLNAQISAAQQRIPTFLQNPIGNLLGNIQLQPSIQQHNAILRQFNEDGDILNSQTKISENLDKANLGKLDALKSAQDLSHAQLALSTAQVNMQTTKMNAATHNLSFMGKEIQALQIEQSSYDRQLRILDTLQNSEDKEEARKARADATRAKQEQEISQLKSLNIVQGMMGAPAFNSISEYNKLPIQRKTAINQILSSGGNSLGTDTLDAIKNVHMLGNPAEMAPELATMYGYISAFDRQADDPQKGIAASKYSTEYQLATKKEDKVKIRNAWINDQFELMRDNPDRSPSSKLSNPYAAPSVDIMLQDPVVIQTALGGLLGDLSKTAPSTAITPNMIVSVVKQKLQSPEGYPGGFEQAAKDIEKYFQQAVTRTNAAYKFSAWDLPPQKTFMIDHKDFADYKYVVRELTKIDSSKLPAQGFGGLFGIYN